MIPTRNSDAQVQRDRALAEMIEAWLPDDDPGPPHVVDDRDLLGRWRAGTSADAHDDVVNHLLRCRRCRCELVSLLRSDTDVALINDDPDAWFSDPAIDRHAAQIPPKPSSNVADRWRFAWLACASAAALLITVIALGVWRQRQSPAANALALLHDEVEQQHYESAYRDGWLLLNTLNDPRDRESAMTVVEEAGEGLVREAVVSGDDSAIRRLDREFADHPQAFRDTSLLLASATLKIPSRQLSAHHNRIDELFMLELTGTRAAWPNKFHQQVGSADTGVSELADRLAALSETYRSDLRLLLTRGRLLIQTGELDAAIEQFARVLAVDSESTEAWMGIGICEFALLRYDRAARSFQQVDAHDGDRLSALINHAICLERLREHDQAAVTWRKIYDTMDISESLRQRIAMHLENRSAQ